MTQLHMLEQKIDRLLIGWYERVECMKDGEIHVTRVRHTPLLIELWHMTAPLKGPTSNGGSSNKPGSRPPGTLEAVSLIQEIRLYAREQRGLWGANMTLPRTTAGELRGLLVLACSRDDEDIRDVNYCLQGFIRRSLVMLGHEAPTRMIDYSVCSNCGGGLSVATDALSAVRCVGKPDAPSCGTSYPPHTWLELAQGIQDGNASHD